MVSGDPVRKYIDREEIVCEVEQGYSSPSGDSK